MTLSVAPTNSVRRAEGRLTRLRLAVIGFGQLGHACSMALRDRYDLELAGVVRHARPTYFSPPLEHAPVATHVRDLKDVDAALICVPAQQVLAVGREIMQQGVPVVECAMLGAGAREAHYQAFDAAARHHRVAAIVGAGWDPGVLPIFQQLFEVLIPAGYTEMELHPGVHLHHSTMESVPGVDGALTCERRAVDGRTQHYVYVKLGQRTSIDDVQRAIKSHPLCAGEETFVFPVADLRALEAAGCGIVLRRYSRASIGAHESLLLEARFAQPTFAAHVMLDAARKLRGLRPGAHRYGLAP